MNAEERLFVERAAEYLERPSFLMRLADLAGTPVEKLIAVLPGDGQRLVRQAVQTSLEKALSVAMSTIRAPRNASGSSGGSVPEIDAAGFWKRVRHQAAAGATGAAGGFFGLSGIAVELPVTTTVMLRSIATTARDFGEDLYEPKSRMECLTVFSLGGPSERDDSMESSYYTVRTSLAILTGRAAEFAAGKTAQEIAEAIARGSAPAMARLVAAIAARFDVVVTEKVLAQAVPAVGALSGMLINIAFTDHFNNIARYHFGIRSLEREYGSETIRSLYGKALESGRRRPQLTDDKD